MQKDSFVLSCSIFGNKVERSSNKLLSKKLVWMLLSQVVDVERSRYVRNALITLLATFAVRKLKFLVSENAPKSISAMGLRSRPRQRAFTASRTEPLGYTAFNGSLHGGRANKKEGENGKTWHVS